jgi:hypothetical protein
MREKSKERPTAPTWFFNTQQRCLFIPALLRGLGLGLAILAQSKYEEKLNKTKHGVGEEYGPVCMDIIPPV